MTVRLSEAPSLSVGIIGVGAFGRLAARYLVPHAKVVVADLEEPAGLPCGVLVGDLEAVCRCHVVIIATPVDTIEAVCIAIAPLLMPGTLVLDVGSVKVGPARAMLATLPSDIELVATHPMFGPNSVGTRTEGLKFVICPLRGRSHHRLAAWLRRHFGLSVITTTPEAHDEETALSQGLTHLLAEVLLGMPKLPDQLTTQSYDLIRKAIEMVRGDSPQLVSSIHNANPYAGAARRAFFDRVDSVRRSRA